MYICAHCGGNVGHIFRWNDETTFTCGGCGRQTKFLEDAPIVVDRRTKGEPDSTFDEMMKLIKKYEGNKRRIHFESTTGKWKTGRR